MLDGKIALITGSMSWDLGSMVALALAKNGVDIVLNLSPTDPNQTARLEPKLSELCQKIEEMGRQAILLKTQTIDADGVKRMIREISSRYHPVDILVNNGGGGSTITDIAKAPLTYPNRFKMLKRETHSAINCIVECLPLMCDNRWGRIINIGF
jgi:NADP-dependent 3-hydroxy acid dehydrogenase YdfG